MAFENTHVEDHFNCRVCPSGQINSGMMKWGGEGQLTGAEGEPIRRGRFWPHETRRQDFHKIVEGLKADLMKIFEYEKRAPKCPWDGFNPRYLIAQMMSKLRLMEAYIDRPASSESRLRKHKTAATILKCVRNILCRQLLEDRREKEERARKIILLVKAVACVEGHLDNWSPGRMGRCDTRKQNQNVEASLKEQKKGEIEEGGGVVYPVERTPHPEKNPDKTENDTGRRSEPEENSDKEVNSFRLVYTKRSTRLAPSEGTCGCRVNEEREETSGEEEESSGEQTRIYRKGNPEGGYTEMTYTTRPGTNITGTVKERSRHDGVDRDEVKEPPADIVDLEEKVKKMSKIWYESARQLCERVQVRARERSSNPTGHPSTPSYKIDTPQASNAGN